MLKNQQIKLLKDCIETINRYKDTNPPGFGILCTPESCQIKSKEKKLIEKLNKLVCQLDSTCWCLKAINDFVPDNKLKNGYFGSDENLNMCIEFLRKKYPRIKYQVKSLNQKIVIDNDTKIIIEEVLF